MIKQIKYFLYFNKNQRLSKDSIRELQNYKLRKIIKHAYETTRFYRKWMDQAGVKPEHIKCAGDLQRIPPATKSQIQLNYNDFVSNKYKINDCLVRTTSGSSGKMLRVLWDRDNFWVRVNLFYRTFAMIGYSPFKKLVYFLPVPEETGFTFGLFRQLGLPLHKTYEEVREILVHYKPHILSIYPSYAIDLGSYLTDRDIGRMKIKAISLNSEMVMSHDIARIQDIYKCPVYEEYSTVETGVIASMCGQKSMHIFSDNIVLEILDQNGRCAAPGERGEVVLTALNSYAMPLIRYKICDISQVFEKTCPCGSPFPLLGRIEGRKDDSFKLEDGRHIPAWKIYEIVERPMEKDGAGKLLLSDFYLVQKKYNLAEFYYVKGQDFQERYIDELIRRGKSLFGEEFIIRITEVENIERIKNVKRKYIHCNLTG